MQFTNQESNINTRESLATVFLGFLEKHSLECCVVTLKPSAFIENLLFTSPNVYLVQIFEKAIQMFLKYTLFYKHKAYKHIGGGIQFLK